MRGFFDSAHFVYTKGNIMTIVNNFEVQRFDSCLRAALYENFISHYADKDDAEIITSDRDFIKRSNVKSRNYTKSPTS